MVELSHVTERMVVVVVPIELRVVVVLVAVLSLFYIQEHILIMELCNVLVEQQIHMADPVVPEEYILVKYLNKIEYIMFFKWTS